MLTAIKEHWPIIWASLSTAISIFMLILTKTFAKREDVERVDKRVDSVEKDVTTLNITIKNLPSRNELHQLQLDMAEFRGDLKALLPELKQIRHMNNLIIEGKVSK